MPAELEQDENGTTFFADSQDDAWHQLGQQVGHLMTAEEVMAEAHLGSWDVRLSPVHTMTEDGSYELDGQYAVVRTHPTTGKAVPIGTNPQPVVGSKYVPVQNEDNCDVLNFITDEYGAHFETAGSLYNGRNVFVTMKLPKTMLIGGVDPVDVYLAANNSHDGQSCFRLDTAAVREVCANTQRALFANAQSTFNIRHTKNAAHRIEEARQALGLAFKYTEQFEAEANEAIRTNMRQDQFVDYLRQVWVVDEDAEAKAKTTRAATLRAAREGELVRLFTTAATNELIRGTAWAGYQAVTEYLDHYMPVQTREHGGAEQARALRTVMGRSDDKKTLAWATMRNYVAAQ